ncbi:sigma-70 family RNA polymerase sigma factor [Micromonospora sp. NBC_01638]|uniref:sigma-70 family RNA polymerase sigma factor n=1 Tax=Micromonospora sp. NBC_01638 TaxID=2975982 RepID=UPI00386984A5|nr:sigma-70 family RNA polymerase sigma factor [Micromonospora sp. NBC_01638]
MVRESTRAPVGTGRADPAATFERVYAAQFAPLVRLAYVTTGSLPEAEDVVQDVFASVHHRFGEIDTPVAYLRRAVLSRCTSWVRRRRLERRHAATTAGYPDGAAMPLGPEATVVRAALVRLNPRQRAAVFLRYYLDLPEIEIAAALACRPGTVKSLLSRALAVLREHLDED